MSIHRTKNGKWEVRYREGTRHRSKTFDRRADAATFESQVHLSKQRGETVIRRQDSPTLDVVAREWMDHREILGRATRTLMANAGALDGHILPYLGHLKMVDVTIARLEEWQAQARRDGSTAYMLNKSRELLSQICQFSVKRRYMTGNPAVALEVIPHRTRDGKTATISQVETLRDYFTGKGRLGYATLISVLAYHGSRPAEALALQWDHVQARQLTTDQRVSDGHVTPGSKTGKDRRVNLPSPVLADLAEWKLATGSSEGLIFPRADGLPWQRYDWKNWSNRWFKPAAAAAGLLEWTADLSGEDGKGRWTGDFRPYDLRHTCASLKLRAGMPPAQVAAEMGHSLEMLFRVYGHDIEAMRDEPIVPIDQAISETRQRHVRKMYVERTG